MTIEREALRVADRAPQLDGGPCLCAVFAICEMDAASAAAHARIGKPFTPSPAEARVHDGFCADFRTAVAVREPVWALAALRRAPSVGGAPCVCVVSAIQRLGEDLANMGHTRARSDVTDAHDPFCADFRKALAAA